MPCPWHTLLTWLIFPKLGNPLVMALWVSPLGPCSVTVGDSPTAGPTKPSTPLWYPALGVAHGDAHTGGLDQGFFTGRTALQLEIQAAVSEMWCFYTRGDITGTLSAR